MEQVKLENITVKIDGKSITAPAGSTVLQAAQKAGIYVPTLCYLENMKAYGGCRLCIVEIKNMRGFPTACTTPIAPWMEVSTITDELQKLRKEILELILSEHPYTCLVCKDKQECKEYMHSTRKVSTTTGCNFCTNNGDCELQELVEYVGLTEVSYPISYKDVEPVRDNPFYDIDHNLCVLCGRCVRVCNEVRNSGVLAFIQRGNSAIVGTAFNESQKDAGCEYCGACIDVCPTGSISERIGKWAGLPDKSTETTCTFCSVGCEMNINTIGKKIVNVGPAPGKRTNPPQLCVRGKFAISDIAQHPERIRNPLIKKADKWIEVTWEEAFNHIVNKLEKYRGNQFAAISSPQASLEENYILQKFARKVMRSNNIDLLGSFHNKNLLKNIYEFNKQNKTPELVRIEKADTILVIGSNAFSSHPIVENKIRKAAINGSEIIVANSYSTKTADFGSKNLTYSPGEEYTFLLLLLANLVKSGNVKKIHEMRTFIKGIDFEEFYAKVGIEEADFIKIAKIITNSKNFAIVAGNDLMRNSDAELNFNILSNFKQLLQKSEIFDIIFLLNDGNHLTGTISGMHPDFLPGFDSIQDSNAVKKWSENYDVPLSDAAGFSANEIVNNISDSGVTALFVVGDIPANTNLGNLKFFVQQNLFLTEASEYADVFLPLTTFAEADGHIINIENKIKKINTVIESVEHSRSVWQVISRIATDMTDKDFAYKNSYEIFEELQKYVNLSSTQQEVSNSEWLPIKISSKHRLREFPTPIIIDNSPFTISGNLLSTWIEDMKIIRDEALLNVSQELADKLDIKDGDSVEVTTEFNHASLKIKKNQDLTGNVAYLRPEYQYLPLFTKGLSINQNIIFSKIERR